LQDSIAPGLAIAEQIFSPYDDLLSKNALDAIIRKVIPDFDALRRGGNRVCTENLDSEVMVMKSTKDRV
jgi:hypothetical protein